MEYRILGPVEVLLDRAPVDIGPHQRRALLALLLVNVDRVMSTERIFEQIWPDDPTGEASTLWVYIARLRAGLEPGRQARSKSSVLVTWDHGYVLRATSDQATTRRQPRDSFAKLSICGEGRRVRTSRTRNSPSRRSRGSTSSDSSRSKTEQTPTFAQDDIARCSGSWKHSCTITRSANDSSASRCDDEPWRKLTPASDLTLNVWVVDHWDGDVVNRSPDEHDEIAWFSPDQAGELTLVDEDLDDLINEATRR